MSMKEVTAAHDRHFKIDKLRPRLQTHSIRSGTAVVLGQVSIALVRFPSLPVSSAIWRKSWKKT